MTPLLQHPGLDKAFMLLAVLEAYDARQAGEWPFGCIIIDEEQSVIGQGSGTDKLLDATRHCEIQAIQAACLVRGQENRSLEGCTLYSTHEPCVMCCGAINHAKISRVVWGSRREDLPSLFRQRNVSIFQLLEDTSHPPDFRYDVLREDCVHLFDHLIPERIL